MDVLLDTSFLLYAVERRIDIMDELRKFGRPSLKVPDLVVKELESFSGGGGKRAAWARLSLALLGKLGAEVVRTGTGHTDRRIVTFAAGRGMTVCTADRRLKEELLRRGVPVITMRQGKVLARIAPGGKG